MRIREAHGELTVLNAILDDVFKGIFRLTWQQFSEIYEMIKDDIIMKILQLVQHVTSLTLELLVLIFYQEYF